MVAVGLLVGGARPALSAPATTADVEKLIKKGTDLRKQGQEQAALPLFQKAYELADTPRTAAQLGLCEMQLGYWLAAESHLSEAIEGRSDWIEKYRSVLDQSLRQVRKQLGEVFISGSPADARVSINGHLQTGSLPLGPVRVTAGKVTVDLSAPGYVEAHETLMVGGEGQARVTIHLRPQGTQPAAVAPVTQLSPPHEPRTTDERTGWSSRKVFGGSLIGAGALGMAGGVTLLLFDKHQTCARAMASDQCDRRLATRVPGWSLVGAGAVAAVIGGVLLLGERDTTVSVGPSSVAVAGRF